MSEYPSGIAAVGTYTPDLRISKEELEAGWGQFKGRGISEKAVPDADEDAVTMGYEAGSRALDAGDFTGNEIDELFFASTTPPVAEEDLTATLAAMLAIPSGAQSSLFTASTATGVQALERALASEKRSLIIASDCPKGEPEDALEHAAGAGAAAFVVEPDGPLTVTSVGRSSSPYPGTRFRQTGSDTVQSLSINTYERTAFTEVLAEAIDQIDYDPSTVDAAVVQAADGAMPYRAAGVLGVENVTINAGTTVGEIGDTGAAGPLLGLAKALDGGSSTILAAGYGSGARAIVLHLENGTGDIPSVIDFNATTQLSFAEYIRRRGDITMGAPEGGGGYISLPTWKRSLAQRYRLEAGRCPECDSLNFPPNGACSSCRELVEYEPVELSREGEIEAYSIISQGGAPPEFAELQAMYGGSYATGIISFDAPDAGSASLPVFVIGTETDDIAVGDTVQATLRRVYTQEGVTRYGVKVLHRPE